MSIRKPKLIFFGHKISILFGNEEQIGVIRSYMSSKENNNATHHWNVYYPFYKDLLDGDNEILPFKDIALGLV